MSTLEKARQRQRDVLRIIHACLSNTIRAGKLVTGGWLILIEMFRHEP